MGWGLGLPWTAALLLGAALAPTDPVLAADVQVGPPRTGEEDEVRFGLTSEAGLNDGAAFPFVHLAIALALSATTGEPWLLDWLTYNVLWEIGAGVGAGYLIGRAFGWLTFHIPAKTKLAQTGDGLIALSATFVSYGLTEIIHSYGFLSVFVTALAFRHSHRAHDFHREMHDVTEQIERLAMMVLLLLFGGALVSGLLEPLRRRRRRRGLRHPAGHPSGDRAGRPGGSEGGLEREADARRLRHPRRGLVLLSRLWAQPHAGRGGRAPLGHRWPGGAALRADAWADGDADHAPARPAKSRASLVRKDD